MVRNNTTTTESHTNYDIPSAVTCDLDHLPAFVGKGWVTADEISDLKIEENIYRAELDNGASIEIGVHWEHGYPLKELRDTDSQHIKNRGETGPSGFGSTYAAGDFLIDHRKTNREWTGAEWTNGRDQLRVRLREDTDDRTTVVVDAVDIIERDADSKGRVTIGSEYADQTVKVAVLSVDDDSDESEHEPESKSE